MRGDVLLIDAEGVIDSEHLREAGLRVYSATDIGEAVERLTEGAAPDVVVMSVPAEAEAVEQLRCRAANATSIMLLTVTSREPELGWRPRRQQLETITASAWEHMHGMVNWGAQTFLKDDGADSAVVADERPGTRWRLAAARSDATRRGVSRFQTSPVFACQRAASETPLDASLP